MSSSRTMQRKAEAGFGKSLWCIVLLALLAPMLRAAVSESDVKAAFLFNSAKFVDWPAEAFANDTSPIEIGVFGDDEFAAKLRSLLTDKKAHGRSFEVKRILTPAEAKNVQMIFVANSEIKRFPQVLDVIRKLPILTIGESDQFLDAGGMINILFEDTQLRFEVNPDAADKAKLVISSKFLRLAKRIKK